MMLLETAATDEGRYQDGLRVMMKESMRAIQIMNWQESKIDGRGFPGNEEETNKTRMQTTDNTIQNIDVVTNEMKGTAL